MIETLKLMLSKFKLMLLKFAWEIDLICKIPIVESGPSLEKSFLKCGSKMDSRIVLAHPHRPIGLSKMEDNVHARS